MSVAATPPAAARRYRLAALGGYDAALVDGLAPADALRLDLIGALTPFGAGWCGLGAWLLCRDGLGGVGPRGVLLAAAVGALVALLVVALQRMLVAGGGVAPRTGLEAAARWRPPWIGALWILGLAAIFATATVAEVLGRPALAGHGEGAGLAQLVAAAWWRPSLAVRWTAALAALGAAAPLLRLLSWRAGRAYEVARLADCRARIAAAHDATRAACEALLVARFGPQFVALPPPAFADAPFDTEPALPPWHEAQTTELSSLRWRLRGRTG